MLEGLELPFLDRCLRWVYTPSVPSKYPAIQFRLPAEVYEWLESQGPPSGIAKELVLAAFSGPGDGWAEADEVMRPVVREFDPEGWEAPVIGAGDFGVTESVRALRKSRGL